MKTLSTWTKGVILAAVLAHVQLAAQGAPAANEAANSPRLPVTLVFSEELPDPQARFVILRQPGKSRTDVILLRPDADERTLSDAVRAIMVTRARANALPGGGGMLRTRHSAARSAILPWAERVLNDLRSAAVQPVEGIGNVKSVEIWLPRQSPQSAR
jgi:hypothetical protein